MHEEVANKTVNFAFRATKLTVTVILRGVMAWKRKHDNKVQTKRAYKMQRGKTGKQTVKQLVGQNQGVSSMEIADTDIREFKKIANKYGVDFAVVKDKGENPKYTVFFKARDADAITQVLKEYSAKQITRKKAKEKERPSVIKKLAKYKEVVAKTPRKHREKRKELGR